MSLVFGQPDPFALFKNWYETAQKQEPSDANAMCLATVDADGQPSVRVVLLRGLDNAGFSFFTNYKSRKAREMGSNPHAAICFHWKSTAQQIRAEGKIIELPAKISDEYFYARHPESQLGSWASLQSEPLESREFLNMRMDQYRDQFKGKKIPRPPHWGGYKLVAEKIEFWQDGAHRLHDRELFVKSGDAWTVRRLYP